MVSFAAGLLGTVTFENAAVSSFDELIVFCGKLDWRLSDDAVYASKVGSHLGPDCKISQGCHLGYSARLAASFEPEPACCSLAGSANCTCDFSLFPSS